MAEFGWAYVAGGVINGPTGSIQIKLNATELVGHPELLWNSSSNTIELDGDLSGSGNISGSTLSLTGLQSGTATTSNYLALDSNNNIVLTSSSGVSYSRRAVTSTITASTNDRILGVSGAAAIEIRLPSAGDYESGQHFTVKDESGAANTKNITILTSGSQTIDGVASVVLESPYSAINIYSDGTSKFFIY